MTKPKEENQMKWTKNLSAMNKVGYFAVGSFAFLEVLCVWRLIYPIQSRVKIIILMIMIAYVIKIYLPWIQYTRKIGIDREYGIILNLIGYKDIKKQKVYKISEIKEWSMIRIAQAGDIRRMDPTLPVPGDSGTKIFHFILYIEFTNGEILNLAYGSKRKMKKKQKQIKEYIEGK